MKGKNDPALLVSLAAALYGPLYMYKRVNLENKFEMQLALETYSVA